MRGALHQEAVDQLPRPGIGRGILGRHDDQVNVRAGHVLAPADRPGQQDGEYVVPFRHLRCDALRDLTMPVGAPILPWFRT
jgi:hypothetical protein